MSNIKTYNTTCQKQLPKFKDNMFNIIIIDPPYLTTAESWDQEEQVSSQLSEELFRIAAENCVLYVWCGIGEKSQSLIRWFPIFSEHWYFKDLVTWKKQRGIGMRKGWLYTREEIMWFVKNNKQFVWNKDQQYSDKKRPWHIYKKGGEMVNKSKFKRITNVWTDIKEVGFGSSPKKFKEIRDKLTYTPKPVEAIERILKLHSFPGAKVLDCFAGSGTTGIACKNLNLECHLIESDLVSYNIIQKQLLNP